MIPDFTKINNKAELQAYINGYIEMLDKNKYPTGKRDEVRYCLMKARERIRRIKK